jgi:hypothetical protein
MRSNYLGDKKCILSRVVVTVKNLGKLQRTTISSITIDAIRARVGVLVTDVDAVVGSVTHGPAAAVSSHVAVRRDRRASSHSRVDAVNATRRPRVHLKVLIAIASCTTQKHANGDNEYCWKTNSTMLMSNILPPQPVAVVHTPF